MPGEGNYLIFDECLIMNPGSYELFLIPVYINEYIPCGSTFSFESMAVRSGDNLDSVNQRLSELR